MGGGRYVSSVVSTRAVSEDVMPSGGSILINAKRAV